MAPRTKIFVGRLPDNCDSSELQLLFEKYGNVTECDVIKKYGFVHMSSPEEAETAIKELNNYNLRGSNISVEPSTSKLHLEPGAPGRAKSEGSTWYGRSRNGYIPRDYYMDRYYEDYRQDSYYRSRPYSSLYDRRPPPPPPPPPHMSYRDDPYRDYRDETHWTSLTSSRDSSYRRSLPPPPPPPPRDDPYPRRIPPPPPLDDEDMYNGRVSSDYLYSRRSPTAMFSSTYSSSSIW
ncbi:uncharacterized protein LOC143229819 isoform X2 [Tachypleus tridentatus]